MAEKSSYNNIADSFAMGEGMQVVMIGAEEVRNLVSMDKALELMMKAFSHHSNGTCHVPLRSVVENPGNTITVFFKPAFDDFLSRFAVKLITQNEDNKARGLPTISGIIVLMDAQTGRIVSVMDGTYITALRTGAAGGLATKLLARDNSSCFALFGCGAQGKTQLEAVMKVRDINRVLLFDKDRSAAEEMMKEVESDYSAEFSVCDNPDRLKEVDIITTATGSTKPLFSPGQLKPGVHINAIGAYKPHMHEIHPEIIMQSKLFVDDRDACLAEPGDIVIPLKKGTVSEKIIKAEIGEVINGIKKGRESSDEITVFKSVGIAIQDLVVANEAFELRMEYK